MIPFGFLKQPSTGINISTDVSAIYTLQQPFGESPFFGATVWTNAVLQLRSVARATTAYIFYDSIGQISLNSPISLLSNTTPDAGVNLSSFAQGGDCLVKEWFGQTPDNTIDTNNIASQTTNGDQPLFMTDGIIHLKNGRPAIDFGVVDLYLEAPANTDMDSGNDVSFIAVSSVYSTAANNAIFSTSVSGLNKIALYNDRRAQKVLSLVQGTVGTGIANYAVQENTEDQKVLATILNDGTELITTWYNGASEGFANWNGSYTNDILRIGTQTTTGANPLNGEIQEILIMRGDQTADIDTLNTWVINRYATPVLTSRTSDVFVLKLGQSNQRGNTSGLAPTRPELLDVIPSTFIWDGFDYSPLKYLDNNTGVTFGPELSMGYYLSSTTAGNVIIDKLAVGASSLWNDPTNPTWNVTANTLIVGAKEALQRLKDYATFIGSVSPVFVLSWIQGYSDAGLDKSAEYEANFDALKIALEAIQAFDYIIVSQQSTNGGNSPTQTTNQRAAQADIAAADADTENLDLTAFETNVSDDAHFTPAGYQDMGDEEGDMIKVKFGF